MTTVGRVASFQPLPRATGAKATNAGFRLPDPREIEAASSPVAVGGALGLLAIQMMDDPLERHRRAKRDAELARGDLCDVQLALLERRPSHIASLLSQSKPCRRCALTILCCRTSSRTYVFACRWKSPGSS